MISQLPLVIACTCLAWAAGLFASQCALALRGGSAHTQLPAGIIVLLLLVAGGFCMVMRTQRWDKLFNVFSNIGSTITQQWIGIAVLALFVVVYLLILRRSEGEPPAVLSIIGIIIALALIVATGRGLMMPTRPVIDVAMSVLVILGGACVLGPATMAAIESVCKADPVYSGGLAVIGSALNVITTIAALVFMQISITAAAAAKSTQVRYGFDPTNPTSSLTAAPVAVPFAGDSLLFSIAAIACAVLACVCAVMGKKKGSWKVHGTLAALCGAVSVACVLIVSFQTGMSFSISF
ncbi:MAG: hypothetical protein IKE43_12840 [Coriobacteriales bacterium]|nr:hypothetical protein [Coriobacteriales bacterium]